MFVAFVPIRDGMSATSRIRQRALTSDRERGAILIMSALVMILLLFIAAFATDLGAWYRQGQAQQRAADVGSLNGMQAYDREYKAYFDANGVQTWTQLTDQQRFEAERQAMLAAINTIVGLLETSGHSFSNAPTEVQVSPPPNSPGDQSIYTITSDNGTLVTITREADGMSVSLSADGDQYFSNLLRDAPTITRKSTAVLSNCGAECTRSIEINPPFVGFDATGKGDGYKPLLFDKDTSSDGIEEIWAVNHHSNGGSNYEIICMNVETKSECSGSANVHYTLNYQTASRSVEYMAPNGKIYFAGRDIPNNRGGIVCFDAATRSYCSTPFVDLFDSTNYKWPNTLNLVGPYEYNGNLYVVAQNGQLGCVTTAMVACSTPIIDTATFGDSRMPPLNHGTRSFPSNGEQLGSKLFLTHTTVTGLMFSCIDLSNNSSCFTPVFTTTVGANGKNPTTFFKYDTAGNETGICVYQMQQQKSACVSLTGTWQGEIAGMSTAFASLKQNWGGDSFSWDGRRTFFGGGNSNRVGCWSWEDGSVPCPDNSLLVTDSTYVNNSNGVEPYAFTQVTESWTVERRASKSTLLLLQPRRIHPLRRRQAPHRDLPLHLLRTTRGGSGARSDLPAELMAKVDEMWATISASDGGAAISSDLDRVELHNNGGNTSTSAASTRPSTSST